MLIPFATQETQVRLCYAINKLSLFFQEQTINFSSKCTYYKFVCQVEWRCLPPWLRISKSVFVLNGRTNGTDSPAIQPSQAPLVWGLSLSIGEGEEITLLEAPCYNMGSWSLYKIIHNELSLTMFYKTVTMVCKSEKKALGQIPRKHKLIYTGGYAPLSRAYRIIHAKSLHREVWAFFLVLGKLLRDTALLGPQ